jgi:hypothetical protein
MYPSAMRLGLLILATWVLASCSAITSAPRSRAGRTAAPAAARDSLAGPWTLRNLGRPRTQVVTLSAVLRSQVDTLVREDTLASQTVLEWSAVPDAAPPRIVGMVRDFAIIIGADSSWRPVADPPMPVSFVAVQPQPETQPSFTMPADTACSPRAAVVQALRETWLSPPSRLAVGTRWRDSSEYTLCRDGIPLAVRSVRTYEVEGAEVSDGRLVLRVRRESSTTLAGHGLQFGDSITVTGTGRARATLSLALDGAAIVSGSGTSELRLELQGRRRTQQLVQHGALVIRAP